ncbi:UDP-galactopyranose mutase [Pedobacter sp. SG908]|uniref:UDP-galactopyranose mutase n=1 Tax=Pedobacter sp. SG908 TaxID=2587135 RepID=UPI001421ED05|nr:UDP-galactopyranose mutase [Pedobacter sp. SG908]NII83149.1 UDP-galactopyranose mutase [Pedobacter sp. SG908]
MDKPYDFLIVGAGLFGAVFAREMSLRGKRCLVIDRRKHVGGNLYCEQIEGINVHKYGPHIFHTNDKNIWDFVNSLVRFNHFVYSPLAAYQDKLYNLPFNMNTFYQIWHSRSPQHVKIIIQNQINESGICIPKNLEEQAIKMVGSQIYEMFIKGYTEKQWGRKAKDLPSSIIKRIPVRYTFDNRYFNDTYQGIPIGGYNKLIDALLEKIEVRTKVDFFSDRIFFKEIADIIVFTGQLDEFYDYRYGNLEYRSLRFEEKILDRKYFQDVAVVNYPEISIPYTRIVEHKYFEFGNQPRTVITKEYPQEWLPGTEAYYPINDLKNNLILKKYAQLAKEEEKVIFGGRLAEYKYYDMHQVIASALAKSRVLNK